MWRASAPPERVRRRAAAPAPPPCLTPSTACAVLSSDEALRRGKSEAELRMQEAAAAHKALARILAEHHAVDIGKIASLACTLCSAVTSAGPDTAGRRPARCVMRSGVAGWDDRKSGAAGLMLPFGRGLSSELRSKSSESAPSRKDRSRRALQCRRRSIRVEFLLLRKACQRQLGPRERHGARLRVADQIGEYLFVQVACRGCFSREARRGARSHGPSRAPMTDASSD